MVKANWSLLRDAGEDCRVRDAIKIKRVQYWKLKRTPEFQRRITECWTELETNQKCERVTMYNQDVYTGHPLEVDKQIEDKINQRVNDILGL
jgi:hypothetical protein